MRCISGSLLPSHAAGPLTQARDFAVSGKEGQEIIWAHSRIPGASASRIVGGKQLKEEDCAVCIIHVDVSFSDTGCMTETFETETLFGAF